MSQLLKLPRYITLSFFAVVFLAAGVFLFLTYQETDLISQFFEKQIRVTSQYQDTEIAVTNDTVLSTIANDLKIFSPGGVSQSPDLPNSTTITKLAISFTPEPQKFGVYLDAQSMVMRSYSFSVVDGEGFLTIHIDPSYLDASSAQFALLEGLYKISFYNKERDIGAIANAVSEIQAQHNLEITPLLQLSTSPLSLLKNLLIPQIYAQSCSGTWACGQSFYNCICSSDNSSCSQNNAQCGSRLNPGTCNCDPQCVQTNLNRCSGTTLSSCKSGFCGDCYAANPSQTCSFTESCNPDSSWTGWTACSASCGGGTQTNTNTCTGNKDTRNCNTHACGTTPSPTPTPTTTTVIPRCGGTVCTGSTRCCFNIPQCRPTSQDCSGCEEPPPDPKSCGDTVWGMDCCRCGCSGNANHGAAMELTTCGETYKVGDIPTLEINLRTFGDSSGHWSRINQIDINWGDGTSDSYNIMFTYEYFGTRTFRKSTPYTNGGSYQVSISAVVGSTECGAIKHYDNMTGTTIVVEELEPPENLFTQCHSTDLNTGDSRMTISWDPVPYADYYMLRVDDLDDSRDRVQLLESSLVPVANDTCVGFAHDVCVDVTETSRIIQVADPLTVGDPINGGISWWVASVTNEGEVSQVTNGQLFSCVPNCKDLTGPTELEQGQPGIYTARFISYFGDMKGRLSIYNGANTVQDLGIYDWSALELTEEIASFAWDTTNRSPGVYQVYCRTWNDGIAECRGEDVDGFPRYECFGPGESFPVTIKPRRITLSGTVYKGTAEGPNCEFPDGTATPWTEPPDNSMQLSLSPAFDSTIPVNVQPDGTFAITDVEQQQTSTTARLQLNLNNNPGSPYVIQCPAGGVHAVDVSSMGASDLNFYVYDVRDPWWQLAGGNIFSQGAISGKTPADTCSLPSCSPYLIARERFTYPGMTQSTISAGIPISGSGINGFSGYHTDRDTSSTQIENANSSSMLQEDYDYFAEMIDLENMAYELPNSLPTQIQTSAALSSATSYNGVQFYYAPRGVSVRPASDTIRITGNRGVVVFVEGDLVIDPAQMSPGNYKLTEVEQGSNLIFIVKGGDIIIKNTVGTPDYASVEPNLEGVFITDQSIIVESNPGQERKFIGAGSFIAHQNIELRRDFNNTDLDGNKTSPTELFIFRPDFTNNWPEILKQTTTTWQEVR